MSANKAAEAPVPHCPHGAHLTLARMMEEGATGTAQDTGGCWYE